MTTLTRARHRAPGDAPSENLYRALVGGCTLRSRRFGDGDADDGEDGGGSGNADAANTVMTGHCAVFNRWTHIDSWYEGEFLESIKPGAFAKTITENIGGMRVQYDHGMDDWVGSAPLGPIDSLTEDAIGVAYEVPLLDTDYNRDRVLPQLQGRLMSGETRGSLLGASFRFCVIRDEWNMEPGISADNPTGIPERVLLEVRMMEFGPVVFGAYEDATSMASADGRMTSMTDHFLDRLRERAGRHDGAANPGTPHAHSSTDAPPSGHPSGRSVAAAVTTLLSLKDAA